MARRPTSDIRVSASDALEFEPEPKRRRRVPTTVWLLLVLVLVTVAGLGGFLFGDRLAGLQGEESGQVPTVHAAQGAIKVRPANPGGQEIPFRDYDINKRMQGEEPTGRVENLLPPPEQPKAPPQEAAQPAAQTAPAAIPPAKVTPDPAPPAEQAGAEPLLPAAPAPAPKPVAPQPLQPKQVTAAPTPKVVPPPPPETAVAKAPVPQPAPPAPAPAKQAAPAQNGPIALVPKSQQPATPAPVKEAAPAPVPAKAASTPTAAADASWQVQLAASRAATAAKAEGERLKAKYKDVLGKMTVNVVRADLGAKGVFYRIRLGPVADKNQARAICATLSKRGQGCLVIAPGK